MKSHKKLILLLSLAILVLFLAPDLAYWGILDHFKMPIRDIRGDTSLYVYQLNSVTRGDGPTANPYFIENQYQLGRFFIFGQLLSLIPFKDKIPIIWWTIILRGVVPLSVFFVFAVILKRLGIGQFLSFIFSFIFVLFYGPMTFKGGSALTNWFLPLFLLGFLLTIKFYRSEEIGFKQFLFSLVSLILFSVHPAYFAVGALFAGILWLVVLKRKFKTKILVFFLVWLASALLLFAVVFLPFIYSRDAIFSVAAKDMAFRNTFLSTHFPFMFLFGVRSLLLVLISAYFYFKTASQERGWKTGYFLLLVLSLIYFLSLNSYVVTGRYFLNDHLPFVESFIAIPLALMIIFGPRIDLERKLKFLGVATLFFSSMSVLGLFYSMNFKPVYFGPWVPLFLSYFAMGFIFLKPSLREVLILKYGKVWLILLLLISVFHAAFMTYWDDVKYRLPLHKEAQNYRDLIGELSSLPAGVVLANPYITNLALVYTGQKAYWSPIALHDAVSTEELYRRWLRARVFFPEEPVFNGAAASFSIYGSRTNKCREFKRGFYLDLLSKIGWEGPGKTICYNPTLENKWPELKEEADKYYIALKLGQKFDPIYRIDYLVVERGKDKISEKLINRFFNKIKENENFSFYSFRF